MIEYRFDTATFEIHLENINNLEDVDHCYRQFRRCFEEHYDGSKFKLLIDARNYLHSDILVDKKIRELFDGGWVAEERKTCAGCAFVTLEDRMHQKKKFKSSDKECFFVNMEDAYKWLSER